MSLRRFVSAGSNTYKSLQYCINQEKFLRVFLSNGAIPMDNNIADRAIRPFTLGRKNWVNMDYTRCSGECYPLQSGRDSESE
ncbi:MAG: transposase [Lachnospiraceae bacterium]